MNIQRFLTQAQQAEGKKMWVQAAQWYRKVLEVSPAHQSAKEQLVWCLSRSGEYEKAVVLLEELADLQPEVAKWPYMIGYQYQQMERLRKAIQWYERALALKPDYVVVLYRKGDAHSLLGEVGEALQAFDRCRRLWRALPEGPLKERGRGNCAKAAYHQAKLLGTDITLCPAEATPDVWRTVW